MAWPGKTPGQQQTPIHVVREYREGMPSPVLEKCYKHSAGAKWNSVGKAQGHFTGSQGKGYLQPLATSSFIISTSRVLGNGS